MIEIRSFQKGDFGKVDTTMSYDVDRDAFYYEGMEKFGYTMLEDGEPIATWGMLIHEDTHNASVWADFSKQALTKYRMSLAKNVKRGLGQYIKMFDLRRVDTLIPAGDQTICRWIEWLGFDKVGSVEMDGVGSFLQYERRVD